MTLEDAEILENEGICTCADSLISRTSPSPHISAVHFTSNGAPQQRRELEFDGLGDSQMDFFPIIIFLQWLYNKS